MTLLDFWRMIWEYSVLVSAQLLSLFYSLVFTEGEGRVSGYLIDVFYVLKSVLFFWSVARISLFRHLLVKNHNITLVQGNESSHLDRFIC